MAISLDDYFIDKNSRREKTALFCRIAGYGQEVARFLKRYYQLAKREGVVILGKLPNPDENNLAYYEETMGQEFQMSPGFLGDRLKKWMPRLTLGQRQCISIAIYDVLDAMRREGKNENMLKNAYIKFMCWMYYKFERVLNQLDRPSVPKILHEGDVSAYELKMLGILNKAGCDVAVLEYAGDGAYVKLDPQSALSFLVSGSEPFPPGFSLKALEAELRQQEAQARPTPRPDNQQQAPAARQPAAGSLREQPLPKIETAWHPCINAWVIGDILENIEKEQTARGAEPGFFYNAFVLLRGVEDKATYLTHLYEFYKKVSHRNNVIVNGSIEKPAVDEIAKIRRENYSTPTALIGGLMKNIIYAENNQVQQLMRSAFLSVMEEQATLPLNKLLNMGVYLLCWLSRYQYRLFKGLKLPETALLLYMGACGDRNEAAFLRLLSRLPVDVVVFSPALEEETALADKMLFEKSFDTSMKVEQFPTSLAGVQMGTVAYHAERELDALMYQDTGMYRNMQHKTATALTLQTMYEEIPILWHQELKYRPGFNVIDGEVTMPVIFAKISGVKEGNVAAYWQSIRRLLTEDTVLITKAPIRSGKETNMITSLATDFLKNGKLQREKIKRSHAFRYGYLREEMQDYMLDKIQLLIDQRTIAGTFQNGMEYTIVSTTLNVNKDIARLIQKFDFTKTPPKLVLVNATEAMYSREDAILLAFLNLIGFDIAIFTPTGYQSVERDYTQKIINEYQIGEYLYDLHTPDLRSATDAMLQSLKDKFFRKGN